MADNKEDFERFIASMWEGYNVSPSRVPLSDWYDTVAANHITFVNRTVQGGLFIKLLHKSDKIIL